MVAVGFFRIVCLLVCFTLTAADGPLVITPSKLVVEYGAKASANCSTNNTHNGMGWEATQGVIDMKKDVSFLTWTVERLTTWDIKPICFINLIGNEQKMESLSVTIYKLPNSLLVNGPPMPVMEGGTCSLRCDVKDVAPVQNLTVTWYKQHIIVNSTTFKESINTPVNKSIELIIEPRREDDGVMYWCEAKLELGPDGPPTMMSIPFRIEVHYKPMFSEDKETIEDVDEKITLNCSNSAKPPSQHIWEGPHLEKKEGSSSLSVSSPGNYICTASNRYGQAKKLFIVRFRNHGYTTLAIVVGSGLLLAVVLIITCIKLRKNRSGASANHNMTPSSSAQKDEGEELVSVTK
ncbi:cell adhesion molecule 4-like isoform X2 [Tachysurus fulvidraco]|uniref:cell adhesion molecule 4-like isoform X2 n=1 Tax=Tachysurus fulvidraco TaxID=1234273 RepID=UPI000F4E268C|nr:cell adhesion molecule 4-like isoform X2 [Tachysurus fulvidraco]